MATSKQLTDRSTTSGSARATSGTDPSRHARKGRGARHAPAPGAKRGSAARIADIGVPSPYALAELIARRHIDWDAVPNRRALLEEIFQTPYRDLFDPANGSPLYIGQERRRDGSIVRGRPERMAAKKGTRDVIADDLQDVRNLAQLVERIGASKLADIPVRNVLPGLTGMQVSLGETTAARDLRWESLFDVGLLDVLFPLQAGYHPAGFTWQDTGRFYNEGTELLDPIQGAVGDCYVIAAMSSVAWAMPFVITDRNRATGMDNEGFTHQIGFYGANGLEHVEVTDRVLVTGGGWTQFCRSKEPGEVWPAVYEKAYAKWRLGEASDFPAIPNIAGGDPSIACRALTGLADYRNWHDSYSASDILQLVQNHCSNGRTTTPMVSWTHGSGDAADVAYRDANVVAGHAYSVLGWMRRREYFLDALDQLDLSDYLTVHPEWPIPGPEPEPYRRTMVGAVPVVVGDASGRMRSPYSSRVQMIDPSLLQGALGGLRSRLVDYVVLRNPWGFCEATGPSVASGEHRALDVDWWRSIPLGVDGVFAMEVNAYHRYFAGTGGAH